MNEQIKLLAQQARLYTEEQYPGSFVKYDPKWFAVYNEKFAELIVRECIDTAFHKGHPDLEFLLKHFGVEL